MLSFHPLTYAQYQDFPVNLFNVRVSIHSKSMHSVVVSLNHNKLPFATSRYGEIVTITSMLYKTWTFEEAKKWGMDKVKEYCKDTLKLLEEGDAVAAHSTETRQDCHPTRNKRRNRRNRTS